MSSPRIVQFAMCFPEGSGIVTREFRAEVSNPGLGPNGYEVVALDSPELDPYDWPDFEDAAVEAYRDDVAAYPDAMAGAAE